MGVADRQQCNLKAPCMVWAAGSCALVDVHHKRKSVTGFDTFFYLGIEVQDGEVSYGICIVKRHADNRLNRG